MIPGNDGESQQSEKEKEKVGKKQSHEEKMDCIFKSAIDVERIWFTVK